MNADQSAYPLDLMAALVYSQPPLDMGTLDDDDHLVFDAGGLCEMRIPVTPEYAKQIRESEGRLG